MGEDLNEVKQFWDDFAEEYTKIQAESQLPIQKDVVHFLREKGILPQERFLDLAGGSGKYIPYFLPYVQNYVLLDISSEMLQLAASTYPSSYLSFVESSQQDFLTQAKDNSYDIVFSAMNPSLDSADQLKEMGRIAKKYVCILRLVEETDQLFTPIEEKLYGKPEELAWMASYKEWLNRPFDTKYFYYTVDERISSDFFSLYFTDELTIEQIQQKVNKLFQDKKEVINSTSYTFELLYYKG
ncbi:hypothetical protein C7K38_09710 [Tetragenococcus osmophilus]|uniref:Methyltransferase type 11 domain-containing protein n=1 Tax=Tetragenococcus osmophilus TaxID=526944 RepID=A0ABN5R0Z2_9ENTE|nr:methyltransferase domain-containing protein [Tetragenococcus osmophilus]AYW48621.1 hypothetical protein C7K38_09710 [Tetragenococcus osmophilus]GMA54547.1 methylase [Alicyclobacillus contaminans]